MNNFFFFRKDSRKEISILGKIVASGFQRDDKVEEISMQMLTGKPVERQNKVFKEIYSEPGVKTWKKTMGLRRQSCFW